MAARLHAILRHPPILLKLDRRAVTAMEYALIASLIAISIVAGATIIGVKLSAIFGQIAPEL